MGLKKGQTNNLKGRPKGKPNKITADLREWINDLLQDNRAQFVRDLKKVEPEKRLLIFEKLLSFAVPKLQSVDTSLYFEQLSDEELNRIVNDLSNKVNNEN